MGVFDEFAMPAPAGGEDTAGAEEATGTAPEAAGDTDGEASSAQAPETPIQEKPKEKIFGRYDDLTAAEKGYKGLLAEYTRLQQEHKLFKKAVAQGQLPQAPGMLPQGIPPMMPQQPQLPPGMPQWLAPAMTQQGVNMEKANELYWAEMAQNPVRAQAELQAFIAQQAVAPLYQELSQAKVDQMLRKMEHDFPDFKELEQDIGQVFNEQPWLFQAPNALESAYWIAKGRKAPQMAEQAAAVAQQQAAQAIQARQAATVASGGAKAPPQQPQTPEQEMKARIMGAGVGGHSWW